MPDLLEWMPGVWHGVQHSTKRQDVLSLQQNAD